MAKYTSKYTGAEIDGAVDTIKNGAVSLANTAYKLSLFSSSFAAYTNSDGTMLDAGTTFTVTIPEEWRTTMSDALYVMEIYTSPHLPAFDHTCRTDFVYLGNGSNVVYASASGDVIFTYSGSGTYTAYANIPLSGISMHCISRT